MRRHPSPNHGPRRDGLRPGLIVIHFTAMQSAKAALARLCDPRAGVSAHYLISGVGEILHLVEEEMRAWHAGAGEWCGLDDINSRSIGIELDNTGQHPFSEPQMHALEGLLQHIMHRWNIGPEAVIGHSDMAPGRKVDPGARFDWHRLARQGLAASSGAGTHQLPDWPAFRALARAAGYTAPCDDATLLAATRLRHRPWGQGDLAAQDLNALPNGEKTPPEA